MQGDDGKNEGGGRVVFVLMLEVMAARVRQFVLNDTLIARLPSFILWSNS